MCLGERDSDYLYFVIFCSTTIYNIILKITHTHTFPHSLARPTRYTKECSKKDIKWKDFPKPALYHHNSSSHSQLPDRVWSVRRNNCNTVFSFERKEVKATILLMITFCRRMQVRSVPVKFLVIAIFKYFINWCCMCFTF